MHLLIVNCYIVDFLLEFLLQLLDVSRALFIDNAQHSASITTSSELHQLLVILSDGRGVFAEGTLVSWPIQFFWCKRSWHISTLVYSNCSEEASRAWCLCSLHNIRPSTQGNYVNTYNKITHNCLPQDSILDMRIPIFSHGQVSQLSSLTCSSKIIDIYTTSLMH